MDILAGGCDPWGDAPVAKQSGRPRPKVEPRSGRKSPRYQAERKREPSELGISIDRATNSISMATDAQERFNEAMKAQAIHQIRQEISELQDNVAEQEKENKSLCGTWVNAWNTITFRGDKASREIEANGEKMRAAMKKIGEAYQRLHAIEDGDKDALTGGKTEREQLEEKVSQTPHSRFEARRWSNGCSPRCRRS